MGILKKTATAIDVFKKGGLTGIANKIEQKKRIAELKRSERRWLAKNGRIDDAKLENLRHQMELFARQPLLSILLPVYNVEEKWLRKCIDSVLVQVYENWELCIADDASTQPYVRSVLEKYAAIDSRLEHGACRATVDAGLERAHVCREQHHLEEMLDARPHARRHRHADDIAAELLGNEAMGHQVGLHALGARAWKVDLVDRHEDRHARRLRVVDGFDGLRHDAVGGGDDEDDNVSHLSAAAPHRREGRVARRVDERDRLVMHANLVGTNGLRDAAGLAGRDVRLADRVEQRRLAVVDMPHDGDDRRTRHLLALERLRLDDGFLFLRLQVRLERDHVRLVAELNGDGLREFRIESHVHGDHDTTHHEDADDVLGLHVHLLGQFLDRDSFGQPEERAVALLDGRNRRDGRRSGVAALALGLALAETSARLLREGARETLALTNGARWCLSGTTACTHATTGALGLLHRRAGRTAPAVTATLRLRGEINLANRAAELAHATHRQPRRLLLLLRGRRDVARTLWQLRNPERGARTLFASARRLDEMRELHDMRQLHDMWQLHDVR